MKIYLDNCCFNRPFDDQSSLRIRLETEAKLAIQEDIRRGQYQLIWSYILDYENSKNPFVERHDRIAPWRLYATEDILENEEILREARSLQELGIKKVDALHVACAIHSGADYFLTTDDGILKKSSRIAGIVITDPINFIKEVRP